MVILRGNPDEAAEPPSNKAAKRRTTVSLSKDAALYWILPGRPAAPSTGQSIPMSFHHHRRNDKT